MEKVRLSSDLEMSRIIAGCMRAVREGMEGDSMLRFVHECLELGIDTFDHAPVYGAGACEQLFGDGVLRREPGLRERITIVTKAGIKPPGRAGNNKHVWYDSRRESLLQEIDESLLRLGTDHVDLWLIHRPDILINPQETAEVLETVVASGKVLNVGVSNYEPEQFQALQRYSKLPLVVNQMEFSVSATYNFFNGVVDVAQRFGTGLMAWSPLAGGRIFTAEDERSAAVRREVQAVAEKYGVSMDTVMYAWLMKHPAGLMPVTGTMKIDRMKAAVAAVDLELDYDDWYGILAASRGFEVP